MTPGRIVTIVAVVAVALAGALVWAGRATETPQLVIGDSVAADLEALATRTFDEFLAAAPGVVDCMGSPRLEAAPGLDDLARYDQGTQVILVRVPATAPSLHSSLVHEFAHHLEQVCPSHQTVRPAFLAAQGHPGDAGWFDGAEWEDRPSEQFAEAVVQVTLGSRSRNQLRLRLTPDATLVVANWLEHAE
jgi:hypothetical protein